MYTELSMKSEYEIPNIDDDLYEICLETWQSWIKATASYLVCGMFSPVSTQTYKNMTEIRGIIINQYNNYINYTTNESRKENIKNKLFEIKTYKL